MISLSEAKRLSRRGNVIPIAERISSDLETPVSAFMKLAANKKYSFLLESIEGGEKLARYSFMGFDPFLIVDGSSGSITLRKDETQRHIATDPIPFLEALQEVYSPVAVEGLPRFTGGGVGYFSYDCVRWIEKIPDDKPDTIGLPEMMFGFYQTIVAFDHLKREIIIISNLLHEDTTQSIDKKYAAAVRKIKGIKVELHKPLLQQRPVRTSSRRITSLSTQPDYVSAVRKAKRYIREGDIFQVVLSRRWEIQSPESPLAVYRRLRRINPSPYMFLLNFGDNSVVGSSPEMMVRVEHGQIETRPIAGTRPRGATDAEDERRIRDLLADEKELAEHTMLLDLGRNDIGRVSKPGTVSVKDRMVIEKYSHVIHIVSSVVGKLASKKSALDGHFACFPAGTVSGAPKIRAMEIIDELEPSRRGLYAGSIAYLDFWGNLDSCIAIRTIVKRRNTYFVQAGAGIVADSKPDREYHETEAKARALFEAITGKSR